MAKSLALFFFITIIFTSKGQEVALPVDFRQHNLTEYNSSLFNPVFSLDENNSHSIAFWSRWQWQTVDGDPTTFLLNYTGQLNQKSAVGAGFFQHNTGTFLQTGGILNYAHSIRLSPTATIAIGANILGYQQELTNNFFQPDPNIQLPQLEINNGFIVQFAPGIQLSVDGFRIGVSSENFITISENQSNSSKKIYFAHTSYNFPVELFDDENSFIRPSIYIKSLPSYDTQFGLSTLFSTSKFWAQTGYNNFYGISVGGGAKLFKQFSIGALVEFGVDDSIKDKDPSFEIVSAFSFGKQKLREEVVEDEEKEKEDILQKLAKEEEERKTIDSLAVLKQNEMLDQQKRVDSIASSQQNEIVEQASSRLNNQRSRDSIAQKELEQERTDFINDAKLAGVEATNKKSKLDRIALRKELKQKRKDSIKAVKLAKVEAANKKAELDKIALQKELKQKRITDSINTVRLAEVEAATRKAEQAKIVPQKELEQKRTDSINAIKLAEVEAARKKKAELEKAVTFEENKSKTKAHYEEAVSENNQLPGYYLIANVFGTKRYYESFMNTLKDKGLAPGSFYRSVNKYNYVYLKRYDSIEEAEQARINKFNGRYPDRTWIFRVK